MTNDASTNLVKVMNPRTGDISHILEKNINLIKKTRGQDPEGSTELMWNFDEMYQNISH